MAELKKINIYNSQYSTAVEGNTVRKVDIYTADEYNNNVQEDNRRRTYREPKTRRMNGITTAMFAVVTIICLGVLLQYLMTQNRITEVKSSINGLEKDITVLTSQNDALDYSINSYIDVQDIINKAVNELGMIKATDAQISLYKSTESEYMKQFADIPNE